MVIYKAVFDSGRLGQGKEEILSALIQQERTLSQQLGGRAPNAAEENGIAN